ncbi:AraC family transcriptional regulator [Paenibacillus sp. GCM10012307]|uniref:AraC family transcriptional regulator n=1 Tax=Paenibacillus roseus TaxID=2798579 RepID=A0A934J6E7_9BACL|nr:AraC family transcriptional regulator [Paenibacillus roseus]MBJ6363735.1 AraC family transcriptional regulator [Paenibacillus roseus]
MKEHRWYHVKFNASLRKSGLSVLFCGEAQPEAKHRIGPTVHEYVLIHTVIEGKGWFESDGKRYNCRAGDTFVIMPGKLVSYAADPRFPWQYAWAAFTPYHHVALMADIGIVQGNCVIHAEPDEQIMAEYRNMQDALKDTAYPQLADLKASGHLQLLLYRLALANNAQLAPAAVTESDIQRQISRTINWLNLQYAQPLSIDHIAKSLGYHRTYLSKMFRAATGLSPMQYLLRIRMERAAQLLQEGQLSIKQIASSVGYSDALYFSRQFRKWSGQAPSVYSKRPESP